MWIFKHRIWDLKMHKISLLAIVARNNILVSFIKIAYVFISPKSPRVYIVGLLCRLHPVIFLFALSYSWISWLVIILLARGILLIRGLAPNLPILSLLIGWLWIFRVCSLLSVFLLGFRFWTPIFPFSDVWLLSWQGLTNTLLLLERSVVRNLSIQGLTVVFDWEFCIVVHWNLNFALVFDLLLWIVKIFQVRVL